MATLLKGTILGDPKTGKSSFLQCLCGHPSKSTYTLDLTDPVSNSQIKFILEKSIEVKPRTVCVFLIYSVESLASFQSVQNKWLKHVQGILNLSCSFIIIIGTHVDSNYREVDSHEAEELAASNGAFHMEVSNLNKRNIELTLKLMRIRAFYLIKKHPEIKEAEEGGTLATSDSGNSSSIDIPLPFKDFANLKEKKNRYEARSFAESVFGSREKMIESDKDMSFADMQEEGSLELVGDSEDEHFAEISIDTLGSPSWHQKVPPLSIFPTSSSGYAQTERNQEHLHNKFLESGSSTERNHKEPLLLLEIQLDQGIKKIEVFAEDNPFFLAERVLNRNYSQENIEKLADIISRAINDYISQVRNINLKKPLYKVKIAIGNKWGEIVVYEGDSLEEIAKNYVLENKLPKNYEKNIVKLLLEAGEKHYA